MPETKGGGGDGRGGKGREGEGREGEGRGGKGREEGGEGGRFGKKEGEKMAIYSSGLRAR